VRDVAHSKGAKKEEKHFEKGQSKEGKTRQKGKKETLYTINQWTGQI